MRRDLVERMGIAQPPCLLIDGTLVPLRHWRRFGPGHLLLPEDALGYCAAKSEVNPSVHTPRSSMTQIQPAQSPSFPATCSGLELTISPARAAKATV